MIALSEFIPQNAVDENVKKGFEIFSGKGGCVSCHTVGKNEALFFDNNCEHIIPNEGLYIRESATGNLLF